MSQVWTAIGLLICSNVFMTLAWYGHLASLKDKPWLDYLWAGLCLLGAAFFIFRKKLMGV